MFIYSDFKFFSDSKVIVVTTKRFFSEGKADGGPSASASASASVTVSTKGSSSKGKNKGVSDSVSTSTSLGSTSESRPRFRRSKSLGMNLRRHPRGISSGWISPSLGMAESGFEPTRVEDRRPRQVRLRGALKELYGIRVSRISGSTVIGSSSRWKCSPGSLDRRFDILLHRSGLTNSLLQARQRISHGHVQINGNIVTRPSRVVCFGQLISIDPKHWVHHSKACLNHWSSWSLVSTSTSNSGSSNSNSGILRTIPPYLEVDFTNGSRVLVTKPEISNVLLPAGLGKRARLTIY